ncbi:hypothetical protein DPMN_048831 [Dreissena polymorpha]|uniref:Uncharacterized protein n=1 Tax=Dreissena polymorpha TaxID=45954 RepID=A0A9D4DBE8_DREPO|nr:hypothetical protein DPMN_048831 [Dreissena polymorpha]
MCPDLIKKTARTMKKGDMSLIRLISVSGIKKDASAVQEKEVSAVAVKKGVVTLATEAIPQEGRIGLRPEDVRKRKSITGEVLRMIAHQKRTGEGRPVEDVDRGRETMIVIGITQDVGLIIGVATNAVPSFITRTVTQTLRESIGHAGEEKKRGVIQ